MHGENDRHIKHHRNDYNKPRCPRTNQFHGINIILRSHHLPRFIWKNDRHQHSQRRHHHLQRFIGTADRNCDRVEVTPAPFFN